MGSEKQPWFFPHIWEVRPGQQRSAHSATEEAVSTTYTGGQWREDTNKSTWSRAFSPLTMYFEPHTTWKKKRINISSTIKPKNYKKISSLKKIQLPFRYSRLYSNQTATFSKDTLFPPHTHSLCLVQEEMVLNCTSVATLKPGFRSWDLLQDCSFSKPQGTCFIPKAQRSPFHCFYSIRKLHAAKSNSE